MKLVNVGQVKSPLSWYGGKTSQLGWIPRYLAPCRKYVEPFGGSAAMLLGRMASAHEVYSDIDVGLANFFRVIQDERSAALLCDQLMLTPNARLEHRRCCTAGPAADPVEKARQFFVAVRQSFASVYGNAWGYGVVSGGKAFHAAVDLITPAGRRMRNVRIENLSFEAILDREDDAQTLFYCDPPYLPEARVTKACYAHEMTSEDHVRLLDRLVKLDGMAVVSGYPSALYNNALRGWRMIDRTVACMPSPTTAATGRRCKGRRTERLWINPRAWASLKQHGMLDAYSVEADARHAA